MYGLFRLSIGLKFICTKSLKKNTNVHYSVITSKMTKYVIFFKEIVVLILN